MILNQIIHQYVEYRKSLGEKFKTNETYLKAFCKAMGESADLESIDETRVNQFLYNDSEIITSGWFIKHTALLGFYRYAVSRNYISEIPLPKILPRRPQAFIPYIYSKLELKNMFEAALTYQKNKSHIQPYMVRTTLILTYTLGLRPHETLALKLGDIDLENSVITIQQSKFYKSRLVPFNQEINLFINNYLQWRIQKKQPQSLDSSLFIDNKGHSFNLETMRGIFKRIRKVAGIQRSDGATPPRLHDLRHTFAVNRLTSWYQENKDVQQLLPILSVYLGHTHLAHTSVYLTMTDKLLGEANKKFEQYVFTGE